MRDLFNASLFVIGIRLLGIGLQSVIVIMLARILPTSEMGIFALWYALLGLARMLGPLGMDQTTMRRIARAMDHGEVDDAVHRALTASVLLVAGVNITVAVLLGTIGALAGGYFIDVSDAVWAAVWSATAMPAFAIIGLLTLQLRGFGQQVWAQVPDSIILQAAFGGLLILLAAQDMLSLASIMLALAISAWLVAAVYALSRIRLGVRPLWPKLADCRAQAGEAWNVLAALSITALSVRAPLFIAAWVLGPAAAAVLDIATRFGTLPSITSSSTLAIFSPRFAALSDPSRRSELSQVLSFASTLAVAPALAIFALLALAGPLAIDAVLPEIYRQAYVPMLIICGSQIINSWLGPGTTLLLMVGREPIVRNFSATQLVVLVVGSLVALKYAAIVGIASAILVAQVMRDGGATLWLWRRMGVAVPPLGLTDLTKS